MTAQKIDMSIPNYFTKGSGQAILFIHGAGGNAASWWQQVAEFSRDHRVIAYDLAGFGRTLPPAAEDFANHFARSAIAVLDDAGVETATVVAHSLGGWSGLRLALEHPHRVERLVLSCTMAGVDHAPALASFQASIPKMDARGPISLALSAQFKTAHPDLSYLYDQIASFNPKLDPALGVRVFASELLVPISRLRSIACPVLIVSGENDPIWPPAALEGLVDAFSDCRMVIVPKCGHSPYFEQPAEFSDLVREFMTRQLLA